ncbi:hypothetical protein TrST_g13992 [Triparma strigata]|uniref:Uncharacterized protein n=1 Tax=Triparma strigata TaxID=1606541 RepID=A0A9W7BCS0_9STRA|nr:hypothetical protein TrST_g13992 [Triparma strigata]
MSCLLPWLVVLTCLISSVPNPVSAGCSSPLATRQEWVSALGAHFAPTHNVSLGSLTFASKGTISNPSGTYGAHAFPTSILDDNVCSCLEGTTCSYVSVPPMFSNKDVEGPCVSTFSAAEPSAALVTVGCLPSTPVQYFAYQTNVFARFTSEDEVYFPEVSPLPSINQKTMGDRWGEPFIVVTTGSQETADSIKGALVASGAPSDAIFFDGLSHPSVKLGGETPDVLEVVVRLNNNEFADELAEYIADSSTEQLALWLYPHSPTPPDGDLLPASPLRSRSSASPSPDPDDLPYSEALDELTAAISSQLAELGYVMSYSGIAEPAMDFGYDENDTDQCCISGFLEDTSWWSNMVHFSTNDCLYRAHGAWADMNMNWNGGELALVGTPLSTNFDVIGEEADLVSYSTFTCDADSNEPLISWGCSDGTCSDYCEVVPLSMLPTLSGCNPVGSAENLFMEYACTDEGTVAMSTYLNSNCQGHKVSENVLDGCFNSTTHYEGEIWAGGIMRDSTVLFMVGVMTNKLGASSFHNIYLPATASYNDPDSGESLSFSEESLEGSSSSWGGDDALFAAAFGRECIGESKFCKVLGLGDKPNGEALDVMSRQYLNPNSMTGPDKDEFAGHRVLVFDRKATDGGGGL